MTTNGVNDGRDGDALKAARRTIIVKNYFEKRTFSRLCNKKKNFP